MARRMAITGAAALVAVTVSLVGFTPAASAAEGDVTYTKTFTVPAPPASGFAGATAGGDGWAVALSPTRVFNVFHHDGSTLRVNCHSQADASDCWVDGPKEVRDATGLTADPPEAPVYFATSGGPGLYLDQTSGQLFVPVNRLSDNTAGVACIDTTKPDTATGDELFCGFTGLAQPGASASMALTNPVQVGSKWFAYNNATINGTPTDEGKLLCFDLSTKTACAGQPYEIPAFPNPGPPAWPSPPIAAIANRVFLQGLDANAAAVLGCFDPATGASCAGSWPVAVSTVDAGPPVPVLDANGVTVGLCAGNGGPSDCFDLAGAGLTPAADFPSLLTGRTGWNGPAVTVGARVYVPSTNGDQVNCFDFNLGAGCPNFPKRFVDENQNGLLFYLYTVNPDPQRPTCLWVNADSGIQIQTFDAYTGGACGQGPIRVLSSSIIVNDPSCVPSSYTSLQVVSPARASYASGTIEFQDNSGTPLAGVSPHPLDSSGTADLTDLDLTTVTPLPQFLITIVDPAAPITSLDLTLTWTGAASTLCGAEPPPPVLPEVPYAALLPLTLGGAIGIAFAMQHRRREVEARR